MSKKRQRDNSNNYLKCPLTKKLIKIAIVLVDDGYSYEKEAINEWLKTNVTSPVTGIKLENKKCIDNFLLQTIINGEEYEFNCPISYNKMYDPVLINTGHTFDKVSIEKHFKTKNTNPLTNEILTDKKLISNNTIRNLIYDSFDNCRKKLKISEIINFLTRIDNLEILDVVKEMSSSYEKNHNMYMKICKVVENYIEKNNKNKLKNNIINAGCIKYIMDIITFYNKNYSDCESETCFYECFYVCVSNILILLSNTKKSLYENEIIDANGINVIISAIENNINNTTILVSLCTILYNLSKTFSKIVDKIINANGINVIMCIITKYDKHIELLQYANDILSNLANTEDNMAKISLAGAIETVLKTITVQKINKKKHNNMNKVIRSSCRVLAKFIVYDNIKRSIPFDCINNVIIENISDPYILVHALPIILSLIHIMIQDNKILNKKDIFLTIIKKYLNNKSNSVQIVSTSFSILYTMNNYNSCLDKDYSYVVLIPIINAMKQFQNDENIQYIGINIMHYHVNQKKITNDIFATRDEIYVLITAINIYINNTEIVYGALKILDLLLDDKDNKIIIKRLLCINNYNGIGIINIIKVLNNLVLASKYNNFEDLLFVCMLIEKLCKLSILYDRIITANGLKAILLIIQKYKENKKINVLLELFNKLYNKNSLSDNMNKKELQIIDINTIIYIMRKFENDVSVQISGYEILTKWYMISSDRHKLFIDLGIFNTIIKAIKTYKNNHILQTIIYDLLALFISRIGQDEIKNVFEKEEIILLIKEICENSNNSLMRNNACKLFAYLCIFNDKIKQNYFFDKGFIEYSISVLQDDSISVLHKDENNHACHLLANISWNNDKNINKIVEYECIKTVLIIMQNNIKKWPLILLNNLIQNEDNCLEFALSGGIQIIVNIMNENKDNKYVHYILKILSRVSKVEKLVTTIITAKIINCLLEFIKTSKLSIVHEYVSKIMINLIKKKHIISELKELQVIKLPEDYLTEETLNRYNTIIGIILL